MSRDRGNAPSDLCPSWVPFGGMPAPTRRIVEDLQDKLISNRRSSTLEQMQGLCTTWDFLNKTLCPSALMFLRETFFVFATKDLHYPGDPAGHITTPLGHCMQNWQLSKDKAMNRDFISTVLADKDTSFLLQYHSAAETIAGEVANRLADAVMPSINVYPYRQYPAMTPTIFPVPLALRKQLIIDFLANTTDLMRSSHPKHRLTEPLHEPVKLHRPSHLTPVRTKLR